MARRRLHPRVLWYATAAWAAAGVMLFALQRLLWDLVWIAGDLLLVPLYGAAGLLVLGTALGAAWRARRDAPTRWGVLLAAAGLVVSAGALLLGAGALRRAGDDALFRARFALHRGAYERVIREVGAADVPGAESVASGERHGVRYHVDAGPPLRLAFPQPGGIIDNWEGAVYDPSGVVGAARGWRYDRGEQEFTAPPEVRGLFGGDVVWCQHIDGPWYRCWFT